MPTIKMPIWIRSEYVTIRSTPFSLFEIRGQRSYPRKRGPTAYRYWQYQGQHICPQKSRVPVKITLPGVVFGHAGEFFTFSE